MKRATIVLIFIAFFLVGIAADPSSFYPVRVDVVKVYSHADGYRVLYRKGSSGVGDTYLPARWFISGGKGEIIKGADSSFPYMTLFYKSGKFDHLKLYVMANQRDSTWGILSPYDGAGKFDSDDLKLEF
jgi:hypothetical protein